MKQLPAEQPSREKEELRPVEQVIGEVSLLNMQLLGDEQSGFLVGWLYIRTALVGCVQTVRHCGFVKNLASFAC